MESHATRSGSIGRSNPVKDIDTDKIAAAGSPCDTAIDMSRLEKVCQRNGKTIARCPACAESGGDNNGEHLFIAADGKFACVMFPGAEGTEHRKRIFELVGIRCDSKRTGNRNSKLHVTMEAAVGAAKWGLEKTTQTKWKEVRRDVYHDREGEVVAAVVRFDREDGATDKHGKPEKQFRPVHREPGGWRTGDPAGRWPLFRLPEINPEGVVYVTEGEKACVAGVAIGLNCTTSSHGSKSADKSDWQPLAGRDVIILRDNDAAGLKYARDVSGIINGLTPPGRVKVVKLPGLPPSGDVVDFVHLHPDDPNLADMVRKIANETDQENVQQAHSPPEPDPTEARYSDNIGQIIALYGPPSVPTDNGIAIQEPFWAALYASDNIVLHEPAERAFYRYDSETGLYRECTPEKVKTEIAGRIFQAADEWQQPELIAHRKDSELSSIINHLRGQAEVRDAFSKKDNRFVHLENGFIIFRDDEADFVEFSPEYRSRNQSPLTYKPDATCNRFLEELIYPAVHPEDAVLLQRFAGLFLLGDNIIQRFLVLDGTPGGGKGQLSIVLQNVVGTINCTQLRTEHLGERFELFRFLKKTLLYGADVPADFLNTKGASHIKSLVGGDLLDAERKGGNGSHPVEGRFNVLLTSNCRLRVKLEGDVGAWKRRTTIVRYENPPPEKKIPDFGKLLIETEGSGILNWALLGLALLLQDIRETGDIRLTDRQRGVVSSLMAESDSLRMFLQEHVEGSVGCSLTVKEIIEAYAEYCPTKGWNPLPITVIQRQLEGLMLELFHVVKSNSCGDNGKDRGFRQVRFIGEYLV